MDLFAVPLAEMLFIACPDMRAVGAYRSGENGDIVMGKHGLVDMAESGCYHQMFFKVVHSGKVFRSFTGQVSGRFFPRMGIGHELRMFCRVSKNVSCNARAVCSGKEDVGVKEYAHLSVPFLFCQMGFKFGFGFIEFGNAEIGVHFNGEGNGRF
jgi:hypothetical protein